MRQSVLALLFLALLPLPSWAAGCPDPAAAQLARPAPEVPRQAFRSSASSLLAARYQPWHMAHDVLVAEGQAASLVAKFDYDLLLHKDLEGERVHAWLLGAGMSDWEYLGAQLTDSDGKIELPLGTRAVGEYRVHLGVEGDGSRTEGWLSVVPAGQQAVLFDIDGTLTLSDGEAYADYTGVGVATPYAGAADVVRAYRDKGYRILYLTARPYWVTRDGRDWLRAQGLPVWHYRTKMYGGLPTQGGTVAHKADYIRYLREQAGLQIVRAYGNAATDVQAYAEAGLPPQQTWIIGEHAGSEGTQALGGDYLEHLASVVAQTPPAACRQAVAGADRR